MSAAEELEASDWSAYERYCRAGDPDAFTSIFDKYKRSVVNLSFRFVRQREAAEDLAQDVFIKIHEKRVRPDTKAKFSTWLYRVTVNASLDWLRRQKSAPHSMDEPLPGHDGEGLSFSETIGDAKPSPAEALADRELLDRVRNEISRLPESLKSPLLLYQFEGLSYAEAAQVLRISPKAVERRLEKARRRLRERMKDITNVI